MTSTMRFDKWENSLGQPYGAVLQVVQNFVTTQTAYGAGDFTLFSLSITPKMLNSKLYITGHVTHGFAEIGNNSDSYDIGLVLRRGATAVGNSATNLVTGGTLNGPAFYATDVPANSESTYGFGYELGQRPFAYLDTPTYSLGDTITYNVAGKFQTAGWLNRSSQSLTSGGVSQITLMEIAQ
jgi:hypothetical protein